MIAEIKVLQSNLTLEEIHIKEAKLSNDVGHLKNLLAFIHPCYIYP